MCNPKPRKMSSMTSNRRSRWTRTVALTLRRRCSRRLSTGRNPTSTRMISNDVRTAVGREPDLGEVDRQMSEERGTDTDENIGTQARRLAGELTLEADRAA